MRSNQLWVPANHPTVVAGHRIAVGQIYVGQDLRSATGPVEPALINPVLPVDPQPRPVHDLGPEPSYHLISAAQRATYLDWLAGGRVRDDIPIGYLHLYYSGLERRALLDAREDARVRAELPGIAAEVRRLCHRFGRAHPSFETRAVALLDLLELRTAPVTWPDSGGLDPAPIAADRPRWPVPITVRIALAQLANSGRPIPAAWARAWAWYHPSLFPATPQTRCPVEFDRLFAVRYAGRLPAGLVPATTERSPLRIGYQPVNPGMDTVVVERPDLPDVVEDPISTRQLGALVDSVTSALAPYSRWLARTPGGRGSVASTALLPEDLLDADPGPLRPLVAWADDRLAGSLSAMVSGAEFTPFWSSADPRRMSREEAAAFAGVLARIGLGVEPDARFGGPTIGAGPAVLFRLDPQASHAPSTGYRAAGLMLEIAVAVALIGAPSTEWGPEDSEVNRSITALAAEVRLTIGERDRLAARLRWLRAERAERAERADELGKAEAVRLQRQAQALTASEQAAAAHFLIRVGTDSRTLDPATVASLTSAFQLLGRSAEELYDRLHQVRSGEEEPTSRRPTSVIAGSHRSTRRGPVVVRRGHPVTNGYALPRGFPSRRLVTEVPVIPGGEHEHEQGRIRLRSAVIGQRIAESEAVGALLAGIFAEDSPPPAPGVDSPTGGSVNSGSENRSIETRSTENGSTENRSTENRSTENGQSVTGPGDGDGLLDAVHREILIELNTRAGWSRVELGDVTARYGVLPSGALDVLNEAALELTGDLAIEGGEVLQINDEVVRELLR